MKITIEEVENGYIVEVRLGFEAKLGLDEPIIYVFQEYAGVVECIKEYGPKVCGADFAREPDEDLETACAEAPLTIRPQGKEFKRVNDDLEFKGGWKGATFGSLLRTDHYKNMAEGAGIIGDTNLNPELIDICADRDKLGPLSSIEHLMKFDEQLFNAQLSWSRK